MRNGRAAVPGGVVPLVLTCAPPVCADWIENNHHCVRGVCVFFFTLTLRNAHPDDRESQCKLKKHAACTQTIQEMTG